MDDHAPAQRTSNNPTSWPVDLAVAALTGVVTTYLPVQRWPRAARWTMHGGLGAVAAGTTGWFMGRPGALDDPGAPSSPPPPPAVIAAVAVAGGIVVAGGSRGAEAADVWLEGRLAARGVRRPRLWLGLAAGGLSLASSVGERRRAARKAQSWPGSVGGGGVPGAGG